MDAREVSLDGSPVVGERLIDVVDVDERRLSEGLEEDACDGIMRALIGRTVDERVRQVLRSRSVYNRGPRRRPLYNVPRCRTSCRRNRLN